MKAIQGYRLIEPKDLFWRPSNLMQIPNADHLERTGSENLSARLWRLPPKSASTLHKHIRQEEFYFLLEGVGRMRVGEETLTVPKYGAVLVGPDQLRQVFNDTDAEVLWLIIGAPEELDRPLADLPGGSQTTAQGTDRSEMASKDLAFLVALGYGHIRNMLTPRPDAKCAENPCRPHARDETGFDALVPRDR